VHCKLPIVYDVSLLDHVCVCLNGSAAKIVSVLSEILWWENGKRGKGADGFSTHTTSTKKAFRGPAVSSGTNSTLSLAYKLYSHSFSCFSLSLFVFTSFLQRDRYIHYVFCCSCLFSCCHSCYLRKQQQCIWIIPE
jgi:hypothetical protein